MQVVQGLYAQMLEEIAEPEVFPFEAGWQPGWLCHERNFVKLMGAQCLLPSRCVETTGIVCTQVLALQ